MKAMLTLSSVLIAVILIGSADAAAQMPMGRQMPMMGQAGQEQPSGQQPMMPGGMMGQGMMGRPMMGMPFPGMGGGMGMMGMMRMMSSGQIDPKTAGRMMQLRGEILKAVGEVLIKHGKALEEAK